MIGFTSPGAHSHLLSVRLLEEEEEQEDDEEKDRFLAGPEPRKSVIRIPQGSACYYIHRSRLLSRMAEIKGAVRHGCERRAHVEAENTRTRRACIFPPCRSPAVLFFVDLFPFALEPRLIRPAARFRADIVIRSPRAGNNRRCWSAMRAFMESHGSVLNFIGI